MTTTSRSNLRVIACGGRDYDDTRKVYEVLDRLHRLRGIALLIHGDARGADRIAGRWAEHNNVEVHAEPADWESFGKRAGFIRNRKMLELQPHGVVAFPGGNGTADMKRAARDAGVPVWEIK